MPSPERGGPVDPAARDKYLLQVTAGPTRDPSTHSTVSVNGLDAHIIDNEFMTCWLKIKIKDYHGLPRGCPSTHKYFDHELHTSDRYSVAFSFVPKKNLPGQEVVTGFDFDHSIRDRLPPGFKYAMKIVTTILDPGIYSDPYSDNPYLYGPGLSSFFAFRIGEYVDQISAEEQLSRFENSAAGVIVEGADGSGQRVRADQHIPSKISKRRKHFLSTSNLENFTFEKGRLYQADFFNPYLDFANFALRIPGFSISVAKYIDDKTHQLRYVMKNRETEEVYFCVIFTLLYGKKLEEVLENENGVENPQSVQGRSTSTTFERSHSPERGRPGTSSSNETPSSSRSSSTSNSQLDEEERQGRQTATAYLATSIYSGFAALGFGKSASTSSSEASSKNTSPERAQKSLDQKVDDMPGAKVEALLQNQHSNVA
jgi:hypothetical protein